MLVLKGLVGLHRTILLQLLQHYRLGVPTALKKKKKERQKKSLNSISPSDRAN